MKKLIQIAKEVADFLEQKGTAGSSAAGYRFSPELRSMGEKLRKEIELAEKDLNDLRAKINLVFK